MDAVTAFSPLGACAVCALCPHTHPGTAGRFRDLTDHVTLSIHRAVTGDPAITPFEAINSIRSMGTVIQIPIASLCFFLKIVNNFSQAKWTLS